MQLAHSYWEYSNAMHSILCLFLPCTVGTHQTQPKPHFRPHTLSHRLANITVQHSLDIDSVQVSLYSWCLNSINSVRSVDLDSLWPPYCFGVSCGHLCLSVKTIQQQHTASQYCPCPFFNPLRHTPVFWCLQPCWPSSIALSWHWPQPTYPVLSWTSAKRHLCPFNLHHTPISAVLTFGIMALDYPLLHIWPSQFVGLQVPSLLVLYSCLCVPSTFLTLSMTTLLCQHLWFDSVHSPDYCIPPPPLILFSHASLNPNY